MVWQFDRNGASNRFTCFLEIPMKVDIAKGAYIPAKQNTKIVLLYSMHSVSVPLSKTYPSCKWSAILCIYLVSINWDLSVNTRFRDEPISIQYSVHPCWWIEAFSSLYWKRQSKPCNWLANIAPNHVPNIETAYCLCVVGWARSNDCHLLIISFSQNRGRPVV